MLSIVTDGCLLRHSEHCHSILRHSAPG